MGARVRVGGRHGNGGGPAAAWDAALGRPVRKVTLGEWDILADGARNLRAYAVAGMSDSAANRRLRRLAACPERGGGRGAGVAAGGYTMCVGETRLMSGQGLHAALTG